MLSAFCSYICVDHMGRATLRSRRKRYTAPYDLRRCMASAVVGFRWLLDPPSADIALEALPDLPST